MVIFGLMVVPLLRVVLGIASVEMTWAASQALAPITEHQQHRNKQKRQGDVFCFVSSGTSTVCLGYSFDLPSYIQ